MFICKLCPESKHNSVVGLTCGNLLVPEKFENGKEKNCGCILRLKTKLKNKEILIPEVDLSGIEESIEQLSSDINSVRTTINEYEERIEKVEELGGGRF